jgi:hypothetical protein
MKRGQQAHLDSMIRKCNTAQRCGDIGRRRDDTGEGKGRRQRQLGKRESYWEKMKKIHMVDSATTNGP